MDKLDFSLGFLRNKKQKKSIFRHNLYCNFEGCVWNESGQQNHLNDEQKPWVFFHLLSFTSILERLLGHGPWLFSWEVCRQNCGRNTSWQGGYHFFSMTSGYDGRFLFLGVVGNSAKEGGKRGRGHVSQKVALFMV